MEPLDPRPVAEDEDGPAVRAAVRERDLGRQRDRVRPPPDPGADLAVEALRALEQVRVGRPPRVPGPRLPVDAREHDLAGARGGGDDEDGRRVEDHGRPCLVDSHRPQDGVVDDLHPPRPVADVEEHAAVRAVPPLVEGRARRGGRGKRHRVGVAAEL